MAQRLDGAVDELRLGGALAEATVAILEIDGDAENLVNEVNAAGAALDSLKNAAAGATNGGAGGGGVQGLTTSLDGLERAGSGISSVLGRLSPDFGGLARSGNEAASSLGAVAAAAGEGTFALGAVASAAAIALGAFVELGLAGANLVQQTSRMSSFTGLSAEQVTFWGKAMELAGGSASSLERASIALERAMNNANEEIMKGGDLSKTSADLIKTLGIQVQDSGGNVRSFAQAFPEVMTALQGMGNETQRNAILMDIFGRSGKDLILVQNQWPAVIGKATEETQRLSPSLQNVAEQSRKYSEEMSSLKTSFEVIALGVLPAFITVMNGVATVMEFVEKSAGTLWTVFEVGIEVLTFVPLLGVRILGLFVDLGSVASTAGRILSDVFQEIKRDALIGLQPVIDIINELIKAWNALPLTTNIGLIGSGQQQGFETYSGDIIDANGNVIGHSNAPAATGGGSINNAPSQAPVFQFINQGTLMGQDVITWVQQGIKTSAQYGLGTRGYVSTPGPLGPGG